MTRFFDIDAANAALAELGPLLATLADQRAELIRLRDRPSPPTALRAAGRPRSTTPRRRGSGCGCRASSTRWQPAVAQIDELGITLRDIESGLIDFPALVSGRQVWLCWQLGEDDVEWWHELDDGLRRRAGR